MENKQRRPNLTSAQKDEIISLHASGWNRTEISLKLGIQYQQVCLHLRNQPSGNNEKSKHESTPDELVAEVEQLRRWKKEANMLLDPLYEYGRWHPDIKLGESITGFILTRAKERDTLKERCKKMADVFRTIINAPVPGNAFQYMAWFVTAKNIAGGAISEWEAEQYVAEIKEGESNTPGTMQGEKEVNNG